MGRQSHGTVLKQHMRIMSHRHRSMTDCHSPLNLARSSIMFPLFSRCAQTVQFSVERSNSIEWFSLGQKWWDFGKKCSDVA